MHHKNGRPPKRRSGAASFAKRIKERWDRLHERLRASRRWRLGISLSLSLTCLVFAVLINKCWANTEHMQALPIGPEFSANLFWEMAFIDAAPWLFWASAVGVALTGGALAFDPFPEDENRQTLYGWSIRAWMLVVLLGLLCVRGSGYFYERFNQIDLASMQSATGLRWTAERLSTYDKAVF